MSRRFLLSLLLLGLLVAPAICEEHDAADEAEDAEVYDDLDDENDIDRAILVARKHIGGLAVQGGNVTVKLEIYNVGKSAALNVQISDTAPASDKFTIVDGSYQHTFGSIGVGQKVEMSYIVVPNAGGEVFTASPALITYQKHSDDETRQELMSTSARFRVYTPQEKLVKDVLELGRYATLNLLQSAEQWRTMALVVAIVVLVVSVNWVVKTVSTARADQRRRSALEALQSDE